MFHVSTLLPFSNGDSQQVIMCVTLLSRGFSPDTISVTPRLLSCKSVTEENQRTCLFIFSPLPPPSPRPSKWPKPQFNKISKFQFVKCWLKNKISIATWKGSCSSCSEEKSPMMPNPDPKQYWNNWKNDMSLFSATNQERPYEQLLHNCLKVLPSSVSMVTPKDFVHVSKVRTTKHDQSLRPKGWEECGLSR